MGEDISKKTVMVLLILTIVVSIIGTWTMLTSKPTIKTVYSSGDPVTSGKVRLGLYSGPVEEPKSEPVAEAGQVSIKIVKPAN
jgi:hypothetical protein